MNNDEELSKYMAQIEQYKEQLQTLEMQGQYIQTAINDYNKGKVTLNNLENVKDNADFLIPIGGSTFINAKSSNVSKVLFDIGSGYVIEKNIGEAIAKIDKRVEDLHKTQESLSSMMEKMQMEAMDISAKAQELYQEKQG